MTNEQAPLVKQVQVEVEPVTILATGTSLVRAPQSGVVTGVRYAALAAVTGAASPASRTISVVNKGQAGIGTTVVASLALLSGVNLVAFDEKDITLSVVADATTVVEGDILAVLTTPVGGTGLVDPGGTITIDIGRG
jgi:hypothetical protein